MAKSVTSNKLPYLVFVYGTLKRGEPNYHVLTETEGEFEFAFNGRTAEKYPLVIASKCNIPFLLDRVGTGKQVYGEAYRVDEKKLQYLDELENHPNFYVRRKESIEVIQTKDDQIETSSSSTMNSSLKEECWVYFLPKFKEELLELPMFDDYRSAGAHGLRYVSRSSVDAATSADAVGAVRNY